MRSFSQSVFGYSKRGAGCSIPVKGLATLVCCAVFLLMSSVYALAAGESREDTAINMVAKTLERMGEKALAQRFVNDYKSGLISFKDLGGVGVNAETGSRGYFDSTNVMTLDLSMLGQTADLKEAWEKNPYGPAQNTLGWAATVLHEYVHMDQSNPQNTKAFEDPAWQKTDQALARWYLKINDECEALKYELPSVAKGEKLQELEYIIRHFQGQNALMKEAVERNIREGKLSSGLSFEYPILSKVIEISKLEIRDAMKDNKSTLELMDSARDIIDQIDWDQIEGIMNLEDVDWSDILEEEIDAARAATPDPSGSSGSSGTSGTSDGSFNMDDIASRILGDQIEARTGIGSYLPKGDTEEEKEISVFVNGKQLLFDVPPIIEDGRTLVPVRKIADALGCTTTWIPPGTVLVDRGNTHINLKINQKTAYVNDRAQVLDVPPRIIGSRTLLPLRFLSESLGLKVSWDDSTRVITITQ